MPPVARVTVDTLLMTRLPNTRPDENFAKRQRLCPSPSFAVGVQAAKVAPSAGGRMFWSRCAPSVLPAGLACSPAR